MRFDSKAALMPDYPIRPLHINAEEPFWDAFGNSEAEDAAAMVVRFCQSRNSWSDFKLEDLQAFCSAQTGQPSSLSLEPLRPDLVLLMEDSRCRITHEFVVRCFRASPAVTPVNIAAAG